MNNGCPVAPLATLQVDAQLGLISVDDVEASFVRCLVAFNDEQLPDEESSAAGQHVHLGNARQALRGLPIVCPGCHRCAEPGEAALRWPCIGGGMAAARQRGRDVFRGACSHLSQMLANGACCGTCPWKHIAWRESRTSCCGSLNPRSKAHKHSPTWETKVAGFFWQLSKFARFSESGTNFCNFS